MFSSESSDTVWSACGKGVQDPTTNLSPDRELRTKLKVLFSSCDFSGAQL